MLRAIGVRKSDGIVVVRDLDIDPNGKRAFFFINVFTQGNRIEPMTLGEVETALADGFLPAWQFLKKSGRGDNQKHYESKVLEGLPDLQGRNIGPVKAAVLRRL